MELSGFDIVGIVIIVFFALRTGIRGFVKELLSMAAVILGIAAAVLFSGVASAYLEPQFGIEAPWSQIVAFLGLFVAVYIIVKLFESALNRIMEKINLAGLDHALGILLGIAEGLLLVLIILTVLQWQSIFDVDAMIRESQFARLLLPLLPFAQQLFPVGA